MMTKVPKSKGSHSGGRGALDGCVPGFCRLTSNLGFEFFLFGFDFFLIPSCGKSLWQLQLVPWSPEVMTGKVFENQLVSFSHLREQRGDTF